MCQKSTKTPFDTEIIHYKKSTIYVLLSGPQRVECGTHDNICKLLIKV